VFGKKKRDVPAKNSIPVQASNILPHISPFYGVNLSIRQRCVGCFLSERTNGGMKCVKTVTPVSTVKNEVF
jgi:hypothetical protein